MRKTRLAATAVGVMALALAACGGGGGGSGDGTSAAEGSTQDGGGAAAGPGTCPTGTPESLTIMAPYFSTNAPTAEDPVGAALGELAGTTLEMRWVPNANYGDQTNVVLAGDDIPDVMVIQSKNQGFVQTAEAGGFWDLTEYLASGQFPNLVTQNPDVQDASSVNGTVYGVYRARDVIRHSIIIRKDWMANLGLEEPTTVDELVEIMRAFTEDDPDGNGQDDTVGMIVPQWPGTIGTGSPWDAIDVWYGSGNLWRDDDGTLVPAFTTEEWRESLEVQREIIENGYVNPDFVTLDPQQWNEYFMNGKGGVIIDVQSRATQLINLYRQQDPESIDTYVMLVGQPEGPNGTFALPTAGYAGFLAVPRSKVTTEEELCAVLTVLDSLNTTEAQVLMNNGIEGENFEVVDGYAVNDPDKQDMTDLVTGAWAQLGKNVAGYNAFRPMPLTDFDREIDQLRLDLQARDLANAVFNPAAGLVSPTYVTNGTQLDQMIGDARIQYIAGQIDDAGLDAVIERWKSSGGDQVATELNELYASRS